MRTQSFTIGCLLKGETPSNSFEGKSTLGPLPILNL